jgi:hypothetical protein
LVTYKNYFTLLTELGCRLRLPKYIYLFEGPIVFSIELAFWLWINKEIFIKNVPTRQTQILYTLHPRNKIFENAPRASELLIICSPQQKTFKIKLNCSIFFINTKMLHLLQCLCRRDVTHHHTCSILSVGRLICTHNTVEWP